MMINKMNEAVVECLAREQADNATQKGADIAAIINDVAARRGLNPVALGKALVAHTVAGPN